MSVKLSEIIKYIEEGFLTMPQEDWDNSGLQIGSRNASVEKILLSMDITDKNVDFAIKNGIKLILSHHPLFFEPIKSINFENYKGNLIQKAIKNDLNLYSMHTDLDKAIYGVNYEIAKNLNLKIQKGLLKSKDGSEMGVITEGEISIKELLERIAAQIFFNENKEKVFTKNVNLYGKEKADLSKIAILGGSGMSAFDEVIKNGCDTFITSDVKYHDGQKAYENDILLINVNHFFIERLILKSLKNKLAQNFKDLEIFSDFDTPFIIKY